MLPTASPSRLRSGLGSGVRTALRNNLSAYGFSVMITASFGVGEEDSAVIELGAALGFVSVGLAVGAAAGVGELLSGWVGWALGGFAATVAYVLLEGVEMTLARVAQEDREEE